MSALRRTLKMPFWILGLWIGQLAIARLWGAAAGVQAQQAAGPFAHLDPEHALHAMVELLQSSPALSAGLITGSLSVAGIAALGWTAIAPALIARADGTPTADIGTLWWTRAPHWIMTSIWHLLLRLCVLALVAFAISILPTSARIFIAVLVGALCGLALDLARVHVVRDGARGLSPKAAFAGFVRALQHPTWFVRYGVLWVAQFGLAATMGHLALAGFSNPSMIWLLRGLALLATTLGVWRIAWVVGLPRGRQPSATSGAARHADTASGPHQPVVDVTHAIEA